jgi:uncharacterized membrane protein
MKRYIRYIAVIMLLMSIVLTTGCRSSRTGINKTRLANNKDDVKIDSIIKLITIDDRDYFVIYARFRNNTNKELKDISFYCDVTDASGDIVDESYVFDIASIPAKKSAQGELHISLPSGGSVKDYESITFKKYIHTDLKQEKSCSKAITIKFKDMRTEEMK